MDTARAAQATLDALADGTLGRADALERLAALATRAREAAEEAEREEAALRAAGRALEPTAATRALGRALGADDPAATEQALRALADRATSSDARAEAARAMAAAAAGVSTTARDGDDEASDGTPSRVGVSRASRALPRPTGTARARPERTSVASSDCAATSTTPRRLAEVTPRRARSGSATARPTSPRWNARRVRRRRVDVSRRRSSSCASVCAAAISSPAPRSPLSAASRRDAQGAPGGDDQRPGEAGGATGTPGGARAGGDADNPAMVGAGDDVFADEPAASGARDEGAGSSGAGPKASAGDDVGRANGPGYGHENGGDPLGRGATPPTRGHDREARLRDGAGPTRSEVIEASARRGFAARDYVRVFRDYQPVVEEALSAAAVPEGRRYIVRRYFQLIRPRGQPGTTRAP